MTESGYQEIDLDNPKAAAQAQADSDIEIVDEGAAPAQEAPAPAPAPTARTEAADAGDDDEGSSEGGAAERRRLTRSQRLKAQRDAYALQLKEANSRLAAAEQRAQRAEADANEGASIGFDLYIKQLDTSMQALRRDFDYAFENGDRDKIFAVQQQIATLAATKAQAEKDRRTIPTQPAAQASGQAAQRPAPATPPAPAKKGPSPAAMEWYGRNKEWFNKDAVMTASARVIDQQMVRDGYAPEDPDYFDELDRRIKKEFPHKLGGQVRETAPARQPANNPTIQNRSTPAPAPGKIRVSITQADRDMAHHLGISIEQYAREKAKTERAQQTATQYTEIL